MRIGSKEPGSCNERTGCPALKPAKMREKSLFPAKLGGLSHGLVRRIATLVREGRASHSSVVFLVNMAFLDSNSGCPPFRGNVMYV